MTKQLETIQRQVLEKAASLPSNQAFANAQRSLDALSSTLGRQAVVLSSESAAQKGAAAALAETGTPRKLAPGMTQATRAFNEAYNRTQSSLHTLDGSRRLDDLLREVSAPGRLNSNSIGQYNELAKASIEGTLAGTNPENRADVALGLTKHLFSNQAKLANAVENYNQAELLGQTNEIISDLSRRWMEASKSDDKEYAKSLKAQLKQAIEDQVRQGIISKFDAQEKLEKLDLAESVNDKVWQYRTAVANGTSELWLDEFVKDTSMSDDVKLGAGAAIRKEKQLFDSLSHDMLSATVQSAKNQIDANSIRPGSFTEEDLINLSDKLPINDFLKVQNYYIKHLNKEMGKQKGALQYIDALQNGDSFVIANTPNSVKNEVYKRRLDSYVDEIKEETQNPNYRATPKDKAEVAALFPDTIPAFKNDAEQNLKYGNPALADEWASAVSYLIDNNPISVDGLDSQAKEIAVLSKFKMNNLDVAPGTVTKGVQDYILRKTDPQRKIADERVQEYATGKKKGDVAKAFKNAKKANAFGSGNDAAYAAFKDAYLTRLRSTNDPDVAATLAANDTRSWTTSYFGPEGEVVRGAIENAYPFAQDYFWMQNQVLAFEQSIPDRIKQDEERLSKQIGEPFSYNLLVQNPDGKKAIPDNVTEEDFVFNNYNPNPAINMTGAPVAGSLGNAIDYNNPRRPMVIKGEKKVLGYRFSHINDKTGNKVYTLLYNDGFELKTIPDSTNDLGVMQLEIKPFDAVAPNVYAQIDGQRATKLKEKAIDRALKTTLDNMNANFFERQTAKYLIAPQLKKKANEYSLEEIGRMVQESRDPAGIGLDDEQ